LEAGSTREAGDSIVRNLLLHWFPAKITLPSLSFRYSFWLGTISAVLFLILTLTGVVLMFLYVPSVERAYQSLKDVEFTVSFGYFLRRLHRISAQLMVAVLFLHMVRAFLCAAYRNGTATNQNRPLNWSIGVGLLLLTFFLSFTGYLLPWDQLAYWAVTVGTNIASAAPLIGEQIRFLLLGGHQIDQNTLPLAMLVMSWRHEELPVEYFPAAKIGDFPTPEETEKERQMLTGKGAFFVQKGCFICHDVSAYGIESAANNHYIGMRPLLESEFSEFTWLPLVIGFFFIFALRTVVIGTMANLVDNAVLFLYFGLFSLWSFYSRLYRYGHNLDPTAPVKVQPFTPTLFGSKQLANFTVFSYPAAGSYFLIAFFVLLVVALWVARREAKKIS